MKIIESVFHPPTEYLSLMLEEADYVGSWTGFLVTSLLHTPTRQTAQAAKTPSIKWVLVNIRFIFEAVQPDIAQITVIME